jgi:hypothetical protein
MCGDKMVLCGEEPGLFQGCEAHGYFIDADTVDQTGLVRGIDHVAIRRLREDPSAVEAAELETQRVAAERAERDAEVHASERAVKRLFAAQRKRAELDEAERAKEEYLTRERDRMRLERQRREQEREERLLMLRVALGERPAKWLLERLAALEDTNAALERRVAELERLLRER